MTINGKKLLPIRELVGRTKYTRDYIAKLAREGSIVGAQVGRQWFVDEVSLMQFAEASELEMQVRRRHLSQERKRERERSVELKNRFDIVALHPRYSRGRALAKVVAIILCGVVVGSGAYVLPPVISSTLVLQEAQAPLVETFAAPRDFSAATVTSPLSISSVVTERVVFSDVTEVQRFGTTSEGILLLPGDVVATTAAAVAALFSDNVEVTFVSPGVGSVRPVGGGSDVPFLAVPVQVAQGDEQDGSNAGTQ